MMNSQVYNIPINLGGNCHALKLGLKSVSVLSINENVNDKQDCFNFISSKT